MYEYIGLYVKHRNFCQIMMKLEFPRQFSKNAELFLADCRRDEWIEIMKIIVAFCNFANAFKMCRLIN